VRLPERGQRADLAVREAAAASWDYDRLNPAYFRRFEDRVRRLGAQGIQADLILFHPYDEKTGWHAMTPARDDRYVRYMVARFAAFSNVWWSLANEWDLVKAKTVADFERIGRLIRREDPYGRPRSIHNWRDPTTTAGRGSATPASSTARR
jgi:hypothetical protein